jgi:hypothetical protein
MLVHDRGRARNTTTKPPAASLVTTPRTDPDRCSVNPLAAGRMSWLAEGETRTKQVGGA